MAKNWDEQMAEEVSMNKADNLASQIKSYEDKGHYYFSDTHVEIETRKLIDCNQVTYDEQIGYIYKGKNLLDYEI